MVFQEHPMLNQQWFWGFMSHPTDLEKSGIEPATPGLQGIG